MDWDWWPAWRLQAMCRLRGVSATPKQVPSGELGLPLVEPRWAALGFSVAIQTLGGGRRDLSLEIPDPGLHRGTSVVDQLPNIYSEYLSRCEQRRRRNDGGPSLPGGQSLAGDRLDLHLGSELTRVCLLLHWHASSGIDAPPLAEIARQLVVGGTGDPFPQPREHCSLIEHCPILWRGSGKHHASQSGIDPESYGLLTGPACWASERSRSTSPGRTRTRTAAVRMRTSSRACRSRRRRRHWNGTGRCRCPTRGSTHQLLLRRLPGAGRRRHMRHAFLAGHAPGQSPEVVELFAIPGSVLRPHTERFKQVPEGQLTGLVTA